MIRALTYVVLVAAVIAVSVWFADNPGEVSVIWRGWRMDTSVGILLALMIAGVALMFAIGKVIGMARGSINLFAATRRAKKLKQGFAALGYGYAAVEAGQPALARKYAKEAADALDDNTATRLLRARAAAISADAQGLRAASVHLLENAGTELAALRGLTAQALTEGDFAGAVTYAKRALARKDAPKWALEMLLDAHMAAGRWSEALSTAESKTAREHLGNDGQRLVMATCLTQLAEEALAHGDAAAAESYGRRAIELGSTEAATVAYARALMLQTKTKKAAAQIEKLWASAPSDVLFRTFMAVYTGESILEQARQVERLTADNADHPESRLAVAAASIKAQLWGQARNRLMPLLSEDVNRAIQARAATLMAEVETGERQDIGAGAKWLRKALELGMGKPATPVARRLADIMKPRN